MARINAADSSPKRMLLCLAKPELLGSVGIGIGQGCRASIDGPPLTDSYIAMLGLEHHENVNWVSGEEWLTLPSVQPHAKSRTNLCSAVGSVDRLIKSTPIGALLHIAWCNEHTDMGSVEEGLGLLAYTAFKLATNRGLAVKCTLTEWHSTDCSLTSIDAGVLPSALYLWAEILCARLVKLKSSELDIDTQVLVAELVKMHIQGAIDIDCTRASPERDGNGNVGHFIGAQSAACVIGIEAIEGRTPMNTVKMAPNEYLERNDMDNTSNEHSESNRDSPLVSEPACLDVLVSSPLMSTQPSVCSTLVGNSEPIVCSWGSNSQGSPSLCHHNPSLERIESTDVHAAAWSADTRSSPTRTSLPRHLPPSGKQEANSRPMESAAHQTNVFRGPLLRRGQSLVQKASLKWTDTEMVMSHQDVGEAMLVTPVEDCDASHKSAKKPLSMKAEALRGTIRQGIAELTAIGRLDPRIPFWESTLSHHSQSASGMHDRVSFASPPTCPYTNELQSARIQVRDAHPAI
eukprot:scaffold132087_cov30-Tisochrysis_lutea.AAC.2